ncbi:MAG: tRNA (adenosine(37)-N6)-dimethylallyltransferase MiaA [Gemmatimonadetes bacterium]|nr:tRNA (adenosine(37)-N6)-dimethylallyltransferase MiaA [Gemmatimonadota bacterium]
MIRRTDGSRLTPVPPGATSQRRAAPLKGRPPPDALAVTGPTASGKSRLALALAARLGGELISMDSRQVYRGLDVGTAKPSLADRARAPHHGLDVVDPPEPYSAGRFARDARRWIAEIRGRGRIPILVGGTGFFLRALTDPMFEEPQLDPRRRTALRRTLAGRGRDELARWVRAFDPARAGRAIAGGRQRMTRTIEVALLSGRPLSWWHACASPGAEPLRAVVVLLQLPRQELYERIDARARAMLEDGLVPEVRRLLRAGYDQRVPAFNAVGYREVLPYLRGELPREQALARMQRATRQYARRQMTWFRHQLPAGTVSLDARASVDVLADRCIAAWRAAAGRVARAAEETAEETAGSNAEERGREA